MDDARLTLDLANDVRQLLQYPFMRNAFEAATIAAILGGVAGYFMVLRGQSFAGHTLSQVGFPGAAGAALVGAPPLIGLVAFCGLAALAIGFVAPDPASSRRAENAAIGAILVFALAMGLLFARLYHGFATATYGYLFGTFLGISQGRVLALLGVGLVVFAVLAVAGRPLLFASLERDVAAARGLPVGLLDYGFLAVLGLAVAATALITGTLLVFALLVAPAAAAREVTARPAFALLLGVAIAILVAWAGLAFAYFSPYPLGFYVTTIAFAVYLVTRASRLLRARLGANPDTAAVLSPA